MPFIESNTSWPENHRLGDPVGAAGAVCTSKMGQDISDDVCELCLHLEPCIDLTSVNVNAAALLPSECCHMSLRSQEL